MRALALATLCLTIATVGAPAARAQASGRGAAELSLAGRPVRIRALPGRPIAPRLTGTMRYLTADSVVLAADSIHVLVAADDPERMARIPCGACVEARLALADLARVEVATPPPPDAWKRTRRRGVIWGALVGGATFAGVQATRTGGSRIAGAAIPGVILGAWLGGTLGAGWPQRAAWRTVYEAPGGP